MLPHVNTGRIRTGTRFNVKVGEGINNGIFDSRDQLANANLAAFQIDHHVHHLLPRPVVGYLATAIALDHRNVTRH